MKWIFTCLQVSWLGEKEITRYYGRGSSCSISRQAKSRKSLQSSEKAWSPKTARSKGARNSRRSEPCLFQILQRQEEGIEFYLGLCSPWAKKKFSNIVQSRNDIRYFDVVSVFPLYWPYCTIETWRYASVFPKANEICSIKDASGKKSKPSSPASNPWGCKNIYTNV